jgi:hypothetical protein
MKYFAGSGIPGAVGDPRHGRRVYRPSRPCFRILTCIVAFGIACVMPYGHGQGSLAIRFFPELVRQLKKRGIEYHLLALGGSLL